ncbi:MAG: PrgI family protein [Candidatus Saccharimonadales bacterium]
MAVYKVPQDVEADDKLLGPFSFRQFIYLIIVALSCGAAWGLSQLFIALAILPIPLIIFFGALALPLRKDQPMETYLAALVSFYLKPHRRLWDPDGLQSLIEITAPKVIEVQRTKEFGQEEAERRLSYLANIVDSRGWAVRGVTNPNPDTPLNTDLYYEAQQTEDILDASGHTAQAIDTRLGESAARQREEAIRRMQQPQPVAPIVTPIAPSVSATPFSTPATVTHFAAPVVTPMPMAPVAVAPAPAPIDESQHPDFNPYPAMHQSVIHPATDLAASVITPAPISTQQTEVVSTSIKPASPDIIKLANNSDLSVETIAREAKRIEEKQKQLSDEEVVISLR